MTYFHRNGFEQVKPPLAEFADMISVPASGEQDQASFRVIDSVSQKVIWKSERI